MNTLERKTVPMIAMTLVSLLSAVGSASAVAISQPTPPIKGCWCGGRYFPPKICQVIRCPQELNSITNSDQGGLNRPLGNYQLSPISTDKNNLVAGRYQTRGPGAGIGRGADISRGADAV
ncbi:hypothetical protein [Nostoc sp. KVJ20]|uniref:hypothetical protein n=1 Tax=Nostoc sp. KVJ20 TaxID=457944 RepID=UPI00083DAD5B|nr:hypothetical protein [Nostoc sp. KVJ20]